MLIKPSTALRNECNEISSLCKEKMEPVFLTKNGYGDLVVMSIEAYKIREEIILYIAQGSLDAALKMHGAQNYPSLWNLLD